MCVVSGMCHCVNSCVVSGMYHCVNLYVVVPGMCHSVNSCVLCQVCVIALTHVCVLC